MQLIACSAQKAGHVFDLMCSVLSLLAILWSFNSNIFTTFYFPLIQRPHTMLWRGMNCQVCNCGPCRDWLVILFTSHPPCPCLLTDRILTRNPPEAAAVSWMIMCLALKRGRDNFVYFRVHLRAEDKSNPLHQLIFTKYFILLLWKMP